MGKSDFAVESAYLATKEKLPDRFLFVGKIKKEIPENGFFFYLLEIKSEWDSASKVKKNLLNTAEKIISRHELDETVFETILADINESLNKLAESGANSWIGKLNAIIGIVKDDNIYVSQTGKISGYLFRKGKINCLTENHGLENAPHPLKTFVDIMSGNLIKEDKIIFGNNELYNIFSLDKLRRTSDKISPRETALELFKHLKKVKIVSVNAIIIDARDNEEHLQELPLNLSDTIYIDEIAEKFIKKLKRKATPYLKQGYEYAKIAYKRLSKEIKKFYNLGKRYWHKEIEPKTKNLIKNNAKISTAFPAAMPEKNLLKKSIKTNNYLSTEKESNQYLEKLLSILKQGFEFIKNKDNRRYLYLTLIFIFLATGYLKIRDNNKDKDSQRKTQESISSYDQANNLFKQAKDDLALGKTNDASKLLEALALAKKGENSTITKEKANQLVREIQNSIDQILKTKRVYVDSSSFTLNNPALKSILAGNEIVSINADGKVYTLTPQEGSQKLIASLDIDKENTIADVTFFEEEESSIFYTNTRKIFALNKNTQAVKELRASNAEWEEGTALSTYNDNIYILDPTSMFIWKHSGSNNQYHKGSTYINLEKNNVVEPVDLAIDGNLFILAKNGSVSKFSKGNKDNDFSIKSLPDALPKITEASEIYTSDETNYIYILEKKEKRVLKFSKSGDFITEYVLDGAEINTFLVNEKLRKLWLLSGDKGYEIDL